MSMGIVPCHQDSVRRRSIPPLIQFHWERKRAGGVRLNDDSLRVVQPPHVRCGLIRHIDNPHRIHRVVSDALPMIADSFTSYSDDHVGSEGDVFVSRLWSFLGHFGILRVNDIAVFDHSDEIVNWVECVVNPKLRVPIAATRVSVQNAPTTTASPKEPEAIYAASQSGAVEKRHSCRPEISEVAVMVSESVIIRPLVLRVPLFYWKRDPPVRERHPGHPRTPHNWSQSVS
ncbi:hypothetical protein PG995_007417 [Apiospora arundinis]